MYLKIQVRLTREMKSNVVVIVKIKKVNVGEFFFTCKGHCRRGYLSQQLSQRVAIGTLSEIFVESKDVTELRLKVASKCILRNRVYCFTVSARKKLSM